MESIFGSSFSERVSASVMPQKASKSEGSRLSDLYCGRADGGKSKNGMAHPLIAPSVRPPMTWR